MHASPFAHEQEKDGLDQEHGPPGSQLRKYSYRASSFVSLFVVFLIATSTDHPRLPPPSITGHDTRMSHSITIITPIAQAQTPPPPDVYAGYGFTPASAYDPGLLGQPHRPASPPVTEAFLTQRPACTQSHRQSVRTPYLGEYLHHLGTMDTAPVIIGSKSRFGRKPEGNKQPTRQQRKLKGPPTEYVKVEVGGDVVKVMNKRVLTRFSLRARRKFQRHEAKHEKGAASDAEVGMGVGELADQLEQLTTSAETARPDQQKKQEVFVVELNGVVPSQSAVNSCIGFMDANKTRHGDQELHKFYVPEDAPLAMYIDQYVAVLAFGFRPDVIEDLRTTIFAYVTNYRLLQAEIQYVYERVPLKDSVITRMVTAYFEHKTAGYYYDEELADIKQYVDSIGELEHRFFEIQESRRRYENRQKRRNQVKGEARGIQDMKRGWKKDEGKDGGRGKGAHGRSGSGSTTTLDTAGSAPSQATSNTTQTQAPTSATSETATATNGNGKGVGGRHVLGA